MDTDPSQLSDLAVLVGDIDEFNDHYWGQRPLLHVTGGSFDHLISVPRIEALLTTAARRPTFRLVRDGVTLPPEQSTRPMRLGGQRLDDVADLATIATSVAEGATLVLQGLQRTVSCVARFCRSLEQATSHPVQANAYLTPPGSTGLSPHRDEHDVFVLQVAGHKAWTVNGLGARILGPGDVLYLPRGTRHSAAAQDEMSLHLTVGVLSVTYAAVVRKILERLDDDVLRRPLPLGFARASSADLGAELQEMTERAADGLRTADFEQAATQQIASARRRRRPVPEGILDDLLALGQLDVGDSVRLRSDVHLDVETSSSDNTVSVQLADRRLTFPAEMQAALEALATGNPTIVGRLPGLDDGSRLVVVRRLIREMVLQRVAGDEA